MVTGFRYSGLVPAIKSGTYLQNNLLTYNNAISFGCSAANIDVSFFLSNI